MKQVHVGLIAPGKASLPPMPATSVEIYLYDLWRQLSSRVDMRLYAREVVLSGDKQSPVRKRLPHAQSGSYLRTVIADARQAGLDTGILQVDNRPLYARTAKEWLRTPVILNLHSMTFVQPPLLQKAQAISALKCTQQIVVNSQYVADRFNRIYPEFSDALHMIYPGVDSQAFHPCTTEFDAKLRRQTRSAHHGQGATVLLFVGRIVPRKGLHVLLAALRSMQSAKKRVVLWVVGRPPVGSSVYGRELDALAKGLPVTWLGYVGRQELPRFYQAADLLVCPSQKAEAFGLVNVEAQASGLPVVGSRAWGISESVRDGETGVLIKRYWEAETLATVLSELCADHDRRKQYAEAAVLFAQNQFSWNRAANSFLQVYEACHK